MEPWTHDEIVELQREIWALETPDDLIDERQAPSVDGGRDGR